MVSVQKASSGDASSSIVSESLLASGHVNVMNAFQTIETTDEVSVKLGEQVDDPQSGSCNESAYLDGGTSIFQSRGSAARVLDASSLTDSEVYLSANSEMNDIEDHNVLKKDACHNLSHYDVNGSASSDLYEVELQKMIESASSADLRFVEVFISCLKFFTY